MLPDQNVSPHSTFRHPLDSGATRVDLWHDDRRPPSGHRAVRHIDRVLFPPPLGDVEAVHLLKVARELAIWFHRTFGRSAGFKPGPFIGPVAPEDPRGEFERQLAALRSEVEAERHRAEEAGRAAGVDAERRRLAETAA